MKSRQLALQMAAVEGGRRVWMQRANWKKASFIGNFQLTLGSLVFAIRHILLMARVHELYSLAICLGIGMSLLYSAYLWILLSWCDIVIAVNFSKTIHKILPAVRWTIIFFNVMLFLASILNIVFMGPYWIGNMLAAIYGFGTSIGFLIFGLIIWREYKQVANITSHGNQAKETYQKIKTVSRLSTMVALTAIGMTIVSLAATYWSITSIEAFVGWLYVNRTAIALFNYSMLICWKPSKVVMTKTPTPAKHSSSQWEAKMKAMQESNFNTKSSEDVESEFNDDDQHERDCSSGAKTPETCPEVSIGIEPGVPTN
eukprot:gene6384-7398_t